MQSKFELKKPIANRILKFIIQIDFPEFSANYNHSKNNHQKTQTSNLNYHTETAKKNPNSLTVPKSLKSQNYIKVTIKQAQAHPFPLINKLEKTLYPTESSGFTSISKLVPFSVFTKTFIFFLRCKYSVQFRLSGESPISGPGQRHLLERERYRREGAESHCEKKITKSTIAVLRL